MSAVKNDAIFSLNATPIHVVDFEGGLRTGVVEFGVATVRGGSICDARTRLCAPMSKIPPEETRVHGITYSQAGRQAPFSDESEFFMNLRETGPFCAHNAAFERHLFKSVWPYPRLSPDFMNGGKLVADWGPFIDTLRLYELIFPGLPEYGLAGLIGTFGLGDRLEEFAAKYCPSDRRKYHCALYDALGCALLLSHLGELPGFGELSPEWLLIRSQSPVSNAGQAELF